MRGRARPDRVAHRVRRGARRGPRPAAAALVRPAGALLLHAPARPRHRRGRRHPARRHGRLGLGVPGQRRRAVAGRAAARGSVHVGGRQVPWPTAPTYYGAAGWAPEDLPGLEYEGREIWGREAPQRDEPVDVPPDAVRALPVETMLPARRRDTAAAGRDGAADRRGRPAAGRVVPPPLPEAGERARRSEPPTHGSQNGAALFEELDNPAPAALVRAAEEEEITADHASVDPDATEAYDPFAATDDELPPGRRTSRRSVTDWYWGATVRVDAAAPLLTRLADEVGRARHPRAARRHGPRDAAVRPLHAENGCMDIASRVRGIAAAAGAVQARPIRPRRVRDRHADRRLAGRRGGRREPGDAARRPLQLGSRRAAVRVAAALHASLRRAARRVSDGAGRPSATCSTARASRSTSTRSGSPASPPRGTRPTTSSTACAFPSGRRADPSYTAARWKTVCIARCATCASRSPTAATSAAPTACRRRSSGRDSSSWAATRC